MNKIKNFRLSINKNVLWKQLKNTLGETVEKNEEEFNAVADEIEGALSPAAIFETVSCEKGEIEHAALWQDCMVCLKSNPENGSSLKNLLAVSFAVVSLGNTIDKYLNKDGYDDAEKLIAKNLSNHALSLGGNFIGRIISDEAEREHCSVSGRFELPLGRYFSALTQWLDPQKIGVSLVEDTVLSPALVNFYFFPWIKKKQK
ncbi:MAG: hypothetical protein ABII27_00270 [bacterium]